MPKLGYWEARKLLSQIIPRQTTLTSLNQEAASLVREKGRKSNYREFDFKSGKMEKRERLLNKDSINTFVEISCRAPECPMPLNVDLWDGLTCPYACRYCFANYFRASLYTSFFDNSKEIGLRHSDPDEVWRRIDGYLSGKGEAPLVKAFQIGLPVRFGIRFEDFLPIDKSKKVSLSLLKRLAEVGYPVMINTKSPLPSLPPYIDYLAYNKGGAAVHISLLTVNNKLSEFLDVHSPIPTERLNSGRALREAGVRVVWRIEPWGVFMNDNKVDTDIYIDQMLDAGVTHVTLDTFSYSAGSSGTASRFTSEGFDFARMFLATSESQWLGSFMLGLFMDYLRERGISCSTFDFGNIPSNSNRVCCEVDNAFHYGGFYEGNILSAARLIRDRGEQPTSWGFFESYVNSKGGFLDDGIKTTVHQYWNLDKDSPYNLSWVTGMGEHGTDRDGNLIWIYKANQDFREDLFNQLTK